MIKSLSPTEAKQLLDKQTSVRLIDVREPWEYKITKIRNAELIPLRDLPKYKKKFDPNFTYIIYCHHGSRSVYACAYLLQQGISSVYNLEGGIDAWSKLVDKSLIKY